MSIKIFLTFIAFKWFYQCNSLKHISRFNNESNSTTENYTICDSENNDSCLIAKDKILNKSIEIDKDSVTIEGAIISFRENICGVAAANATICNLKIKARNLVIKDSEIKGAIEIESENVNITNFQTSIGPQCINTFFQFQAYLNYKPCFLTIHVSRILIIRKTSLYHVAVFLSGKKLLLEDSEIKTNGVSFDDREMVYRNISNKGIRQGFGFAGFGAFCNEVNFVDNSYGSSVQESDSYNDTNFYGMGFGGGRIQIKFEYLRATNSGIYSNGNFSGTGGYIYLSFQILETFNFEVQANGNHIKSEDSSILLMGSGGRIILDLPLSFSKAIFDNFISKSNISNSISVMAIGGTMIRKDVRPCTRGAAGTIYLKSLFTVVISNGELPTESQTKIESYPFKKILVSGYAAAFLKENKLNVKFFFLLNAFFFVNNLVRYSSKNILSQDPVSTNISVNAEIVQINNSAIGNNYPHSQYEKRDEFSNLNWNSINLTFIKAKIEILSKTYFFAENINFYAKMISKSIYLSNVISFAFKKMEVHQYSEIQAPTLEFIGDLFKSQGNIRATKKECTMKKKGKSEIQSKIVKDKLRFSNSFSLSLIQPLLNLEYTLKIIGETFILTGSQISASKLLVNVSKSQILENATLNSNGLGCTDRESYGGGKYDDFLSSSCGATGASYGGKGQGGIYSTSVGIEECLRLESGSIYGSYEFPLEEGSGGGAYSTTDTDITRGGGIVILNSTDELLLNGTVSSNGLYTSHLIDSLPNGAGSGGTVQIYTKKIKGKGIIEASGGNINWLNSGAGFLFLIKVVVEE